MHLEVEVEVVVEAGVAVVVVLVKRNSLLKAGAVGILHKHQVWPLELVDDEAVVAVLEVAETRYRNNPVVAVAAEDSLHMALLPELEDRQHTAVEVDHMGLGKGLEKGLQLSWLCRDWYNMCFLPVTYQLVENYILR
jgi:hypothetical protein